MNYKNLINKHLVTLAPGGFYFGPSPTTVSTLLGSCVAISVWHPVLKVGGLCHYLLPTRSADSKELDGHYADEAMQLFLENMARLNTRPSEYQAKLFGGGNMFGELVVISKHIGRKNIETGRALLTQHGISLVAESVGGYEYRNILFNIDNGDVWVRSNPTQ